MSRFLTEQEYVDENRRQFRRLHQRDGVWWTQIYPGFCRPAFKFRSVVPGTAKPLRSQALLGYSHFVPEMGMGNDAVRYMVLEGDDLRGFGMARLDSKKRNQVRKGLKCCEVRTISDLEGCLEDAREVCVSHSLRGAASRKAYHVSHTFFIDQADTWRAQMRRDFASGGRQWFGAWHEGRLIAYLVTLQVESVLLIEKMKLHSDYLALGPSDALYFHVLSQLAQDASCLRIINSSPQRPGLDRFKEQFLFKATPIPQYVSNPATYRLAMRAMALRNKWVEIRRARRARGTDAGADEADS